MARATRAAADALQLKRVAPDAPSPAATGIFMPPGVPGGALQKYLRYTLGVEVAGGQDSLKGKALRLAHIGYIGDFDVITGIAALEMALSRFGVEVAFGRGVGAAQAVLAEGLPAPAA
jgi:aspartate aminotransferase-like enzyme